MQPNYSSDHFYSYDHLAQVIEEMELEPADGLQILREMLYETQVEEVE